MDPDDDLIRRAVGAGRTEAHPPASILERAITSASRRRRGVVLLSAAASIAVVTAGVLALGRDTDDEIVGVPPTPASTPVITPVATHVPTSLSVIPTTETTVPPTSATTSTTAAPPTAVSTPPFVYQPPEPTVERATTETLQVGSRTVTVTTAGAAAVPRDALAARAPRGATQLWSFDGVASSVVAGVSVEPCTDGAWCAVAHAYDGRYWWVGIDGVPTTDLLGLAEPVVLVRVDLLAGVVEPVSVPSLETQIYDVLPDGRGGAIVAGRAASDVRVWTVGSDLTATAENGLPVVEPWSARLSDDGRVLAYTLADPAAGTNSVHVIELATGLDRLVAEEVAIMPFVLDWTNGGSTLLMAEVYEEHAVYELQIGPVPVTNPDVTYYSDGCARDDQLVVGRWFAGYAEDAPEPGVLEVLGPDRSPVQQLSGPVLGGGLVCLGNGSVAMALWHYDEVGAATADVKAVVFSPEGERVDLGTGVESVPVPMRIVGVG